LSRRNLQSLLHKLDWEGSHRSIQRQERSHGPILTVIAEDDPEHYVDRTPGPMHPITEAAITKSDMLDAMEALIHDRGFEDYVHHD